ncbi:MAG: heavy-metal-associated domain-containing protein [Variovorax sp.]
MIVFEVKDMTCGHCASTIGKAIAGVDMDARVKFDLALHRVEIEPAEADVEALSAAIHEAGYTPLVLDGTPAQPGDGRAAQRSGCCGGH